MPAAASGSTRGPFASAAALYSQHLVRPPSAYHPVSGGGRQGRRRPRSASAATTTATQRKPAAPNPPIPASASSSSRTRTGHKPSSTQAAVRPASAATVGEARARRTASRPSRPRPVTATGVTNAHRSTALHHDYIVKGPAWGYDKKRDDGAESRGQVEGSVVRDSVIGEETASASRYWHEHKSLGVDPAVMRKAGEFVARILHARREGEQQKAQQQNGPSTAQSQVDRRVPLAFKPSHAESNDRPQYGTAKRNSAARNNKVRHVGQGRRGRGLKTTAVSATVAGTSSRKNAIPVRAKSTLRTEAEALNSSGRKTGQLLGTTSILSANSSQVPFPPGGSGRDLGNIVAEDDSYVKHEQPLQGVNEFVGGEGEGNNGKPPEQENHSSLVMTPLNFDVFCSLRPTLLMQARTKQRQQKTSTTSGVAGLSAIAQGNTGQSGNLSNHDAGRSRCEVDEEAELILTAPGGPSFGDTGGRRPSCAWTSIFGAVCAGAERGRARTEVLEAARRESLRQSKRRRRSADASAAAQRAQLVRVNDTPAFPATIVESAETPVTHTGSAMDAADTRCTLLEDEVVRTTGVEGPVTGNPVTHGDGSCEVVVEDAEDEGTQTLTLHERTTSGTQSNHEPEIADNSKASDIANISPSSHDMGVEISGPFQDEPHNQSTPQKTPARLITGHQERPSPIATVTTPLFRHPFGGGSTRISVNAPRSLQVCPGERGFGGVSASETSRYCFSLRRGRHTAHEQQPSAPGPRRKVSRRPSTASSDACSAIVATSSVGEGAGDGSQFGELEMRAGSGLRPETASSFFSRSDSRGGKRVGAAWMNHTGKIDRGFPSPRWTNGECLRRRVDRILDSVSKKVQPGDSVRSHASSTCFQQGQPQEDAEEGAEERRVEDDAAKYVTHATETGPTVRRSETVHAGLDIPDNIAQEPDRATRAASGVSGALNSAEDSASRGDAVVEPLDEFGVNSAEPGSATRRNSNEALDRGGEADDEPGRPRVCVKNAIRGTPASIDGAVSSDFNGSALPAYRGLSGRRRRPSSAPSRCLTDGGKPRSRFIHSPGLFVAVFAKRSKSCPGLIQRADNTVGGFAATEAYPKETGQCPGRSESYAIPGEASSDAAGDGGGGGKVHDGACLGTTVVEGTASPNDGRDPRDAPVPDRGEDGETKQEGERGERGETGETGETGGDERSKEIAAAAAAAAARRGSDGRAGAGAREGAEGAGAGTGAEGEGADDERGDRGGNSVSAERNYGTRLKSACKGHACIAAGVPEGQVVRARNFHPKTCAAGLGTAVVGTQGSGVKTCLETNAAAVPAEMETPLDFAKATVKLKVMAAEASVAVDEHEKAWGVSKEKAEVLFNDLRLAPEEDAQQSCDDAASATRHRLQSILVKSGVESSRRVKKEADLEEVRRVLKQDTTMYEARKSASDRLHEAVRTLEAENDSCDLLQLLEWRRGRSLSMLRERTERERDCLRAACRRRREEAAAMDITLAEARHAHGRLVGHVQHMVERLSCLVEYVRIMRRWCQEHLESRRHARVTSKAINLEFGRKSEELDAVLKKGGLMQSAAGAASRAPRKGEARQAGKSRCFDTAGTTLIRNQDHNDDDPSTTASTTTHIMPANLTGLIKLVNSGNNDDLIKTSTKPNTNPIPNHNSIPNPRETTGSHLITPSNPEDMPPSFTALFDATSMLRGSLDVLALEYRPQFRSPLHPLPEK